MSRDQRVKNNWALLRAQDIAIEHNQPLAVIFTLSDSFLGSTCTHYNFMLDGLKLVEEELKRLNIRLILLCGNPAKEISKFSVKYHPAAIISDFSPLKINRMWKKQVLSELKNTRFIEVDAHNIVPCRQASTKQEYSARTIRPKIQRLLPEFLTAFPELKVHPFTYREFAHENHWYKIRERMGVDNQATIVSRIKPGTDEAAKTLKLFKKNGLERYSKERNDPVKEAQSGLSPYLHFGHISAQYAALEIEESDAGIETKEVFLEELVIRRELADNYCLYNDNYDSFNGFPEWSKKTLNAHRKDVRNYIYSIKEFENAETHDRIWNASQTELIKKGKMHGYMRMYWAKKILEWSASPEEAMETAVMLNDKYEMDGRDPNGYAGIAWSIGGVHDRPWFSRPVYGSVRYMSDRGLMKKFDTEEYIRRCNKL